MRLRPNTKIAIFLTLSVLLLLVLARLTWRTPKPLLFFLVATFILVGACFWPLLRREKRLSGRQIIAFALIWLAFSGATLAGVYHVDRAGWLWFRVSGFDVTLAEEYPELVELSAQEFVQRFNIFALDDADPQTVVLKRGSYEIDETIVVPKNLRLAIKPGARLHFGPGCSLISYGPIDARGTDENPIIFAAKNKLLKWGVVGIVATEKSFFDYVHVRHCRQALVNGIDFYAGLSVIEADVEIRNSKFLHTFGKDAVNVQHGEVAIVGNLFKNSFKDGLDLDGGRGEVRDNRFIDCRDEGIDLSENHEHLKVFDNEIYDSKGGRLAADNNLEEIAAANTLGFMQR